MKQFFAIPSLLAGLAGLLGAQEFHRATFNVGAGFTQPVGRTGDNLDMGWNVHGGAGVNFNPYVGAMLNVGYDHMGITSTTLSNFGVPGGDVHVLSATIDPIVHVNPHGHFDVYITGGGGFYHWYQEFTQPSVAVVTGFNPFFGFFPATVGTTQVLGSYSVNKPGWDIGAGVAFGSMLHGKFFAEAKYNRIFMSNARADYVPVTFGFRW